MGGGEVFYFFGFTAFAMPLLDLPRELLQKIMFSVPVAHDIALAAPTSRAISDAARNAFKVRPFTGDVVTLAGHGRETGCVAVATHSRIVTGARWDAKLWRYRVVGFQFC